MASEKLHFNPQTLRFEKEDVPAWRWLSRALPFFILLAFFFTCGFFLFDRNIETADLRSLGEKQTDILLKMDLLKVNLFRCEKILGDITYNDDNIYRTYFEVDPVPGSKRNAGFGGKEDSRQFKTSKYNRYFASVDRELDILAKKLVVQSKSFDEVVGMARDKEKRLAARPAIQPVSINDLVRFGSPFGMRMHPILKVMKMHEGIDFTASRGTKVFATADGSVTQASMTGGGYGNKIVIDHGYGYETLYGHLYKILVEPGQKVKRGDVIGLVGSTGLSVCPHLHYEVIVNRKKVNPVNFYTNDLTAAEYDRMIELLSQADPGFDIN